MGLFRGVFGSRSEPVAAGAPARLTPPPAPPAAQYVINNPSDDGVIPTALPPGTGRGYFVQAVGESFCAVSTHARTVERGKKNRHLLRSISVGHGSEAECA